MLSFVLDDEPPQLEGEIIVSADTAEREAAEAGWSAADELLLYVDSRHAAPGRLRRQRRRRRGRNARGRSGRARRNSA